MVLTEDKKRSHLMYVQIQAFDEKTALCHKTFDVATLHKMLTDLVARRHIPINLNSLQSLREIVYDEVAKRRFHGNTRNGGLAGDPVLDYFRWFFSYILYLRHLKKNFIERIFEPLFKYFHDGGSEDDVENSAYSGSQVSLQSYGSMGNISLLDTGSTGSASLAPSRLSLPESRYSYASKTALAKLSNEFEDIRKLYDTKEMDKIAQRLSSLKDQLDFLLDDEEEKIQIGLFSQDSYHAISEIRKSNYSLNLTRLIPDVLVKFKKAAWLARRWLLYDDEKSKDADERYTKIVHIYQEMQHRLVATKKNISEKEKLLAKESEELHNLLSLEEKSSELEMTIYDIDDKISFFQKNITKLRDERRYYTRCLIDAVKHKDTGDYNKYKVMYERNRLQRYAAERHLTTLKYQRNVIQTERGIGLALLPSIIRFTNTVQENCEKLEAELEKDREHQYTLSYALIPLQQDRDNMSARFQRDLISMSSRSSSLEYTTDNFDLEGRPKSGARDKGKLFPDVNSTKADASSTVDDHIHIKVIHTSPIPLKVQKEQHIHDLKDDLSIVDIQNTTKITKQPPTTLNIISKSSTPDWADDSPTFMVQTQRPKIENPSTPDW